MGAQSSAQARDAEPQSSMRPGWPQGQPPDMVWGSDRGLQATLQVHAPVPDLRHAGALTRLHDCVLTRLTLLA